MRILLRIAACLVLACLAAVECRAAVVVLANRTARDLQFRLVTSEGKSHNCRLEAGDALPYPVDGSARITFGSTRGEVAYELSPNSAYFFYDAESRGLDLEQIGLHGQTARRPIESHAERAPMADLATVTVRVYVDEEQRLAPEAWQKRLTDRIEQASQIFERQCRVRFKVVAFGTWPSDDSLDDFQQSLKEFERLVTAHPADLAIGFTSQHPEPGPETELGGTRAPFHPYVLIREWPRHVTEPERLEILVHELGHYLGASHSPEATSAMRARKGGRRAIWTRNRIGLDPVNTLILSLIGEEMRTRKIASLRDLSLDTRVELHSIYETLAQAMPDDKAAAIYARMLNVVDRPTPVLLHSDE